MWRSPKRRPRRGVRPPRPRPRPLRRLVRDRGDPPRGDPPRGDPPRRRATPGGSVVARVPPTQDGGADRHRRTPERRGGQVGGARASRSRTRRRNRTEEPSRRGRVRGRRRVGLERVGRRETRSTGTRRASSVILAFFEVIAIGVVNAVTDTVIATSITVSTILTTIARGVRSASASITGTATSGGDDRRRRRRWRRRAAPGRRNAPSRRRRRSARRAHRTRRRTRHDPRVVQDGPRGDDATVVREPRQPPGRRLRVLPRRATRTAVKNNRRESEEQPERTTGDRRASPRRPTWRWRRANRTNAHGRAAPRRSFFLGVLVVRFLARRASSTFIYEKIFAALVRAGPATGTRSTVRAPRRLETPPRRGTRPPSRPRLCVSRAFASRARSPVRRGTPRTRARPTRERAFPGAFVRRRRQTPLLRRLAHARSGSAATARAATAPRSQRSTTNATPDEFPDEFDAPPMFASSRETTRHRAWTPAHSRNDVWYPGASGHSPSEEDHEEDHDDDDAKAPSWKFDLDARRTSARPHPSPGGTRVGVPVSTVSRASARAAGPGAKPKGRRRAEVSRRRRDAARARLTAARSASTAASGVVPTPSTTRGARRGPPMVQRVPVREPPAPRGAGSGPPTVSRRRAPPRRTRRWRRREARGRGRRASPLALRKGPSRYAARGSWIPVGGVSFARRSPPRRARRTPRIRTRTQRRRTSRDRPRSRLRPTTGAPKDRSARGFESRRGESPPATPPRGGSASAALASRGGARGARGGGATVVADGRSPRPGGRAKGVPSPRRYPPPTRLGNT